MKEIFILFNGRIHKQRGRKIAPENEFLIYVPYLRTFQIEYKVKFVQK